MSIEQMQETTVSVGARAKMNSGERWFDSASGCTGWDSWLSREIGLCVRMSAGCWSLRRDPAIALGPVPLARYATIATEEVAESSRPLIVAYERSASMESRYVRPSGVRTVAPRTGS
jgi:hypothetical protein